MVSSSSSGLSEASSQPDGLMQSLSFCKEYTPPTVECPQLDNFLSMLTNSTVVSSVDLDDATLTGDAGKAVMGYTLYQVLYYCMCVCRYVRICLCTSVCAYSMYVYMCVYCVYNKVISSSAQ